MRYSSYVLLTSLFLFILSGIFTKLYIDNWERYAQPYQTVDKNTGELITEYKLANRSDDFLAFSLILGAIATLLLALGLIERVYND